MSKSNELQNIVVLKSDTYDCGGSDYNNIEQPRFSTIFENQSTYGQRYISKGFDKHEDSKYAPNYYEKRPILSDDIGVMSEELKPENQNFYHHEFPTSDNKTEKFTTHPYDSPQGVEDTWSSGIIPVSGPNIPDTLESFTKKIESFEPATSSVITIIVIVIIILISLYIFFRYRKSKQEKNNLFNRYDGGEVDEYDDVEIFDLNNNDEMRGSDEPSVYTVDNNQFYEAFHTSIDMPEGDVFVVEEQPRHEFMTSEDDDAEQFVLNVKIEDDKLVKYYHYYDKNTRILYRLDKETYYNGELIEKSAEKYYNKNKIRYRVVDTYDGHYLLKRKMFKVFNLEPLEFDYGVIKFENGLPINFVKYHYNDEDKQYTRTTDSDFVNDVPRSSQTISIEPNDIPVSNMDFVPSMEDLAFKNPDCYEDPLFDLTDNRDYNDDDEEENEHPFDFNINNNMEGGAKKPKKSSKKTSKKTTKKTSKKSSKKSKSKK